MGVYAGGVRQALSGLLAGEPWNWAEMGVTVLLWGLLWTPATWLGRWVAERGVLRRDPSAGVRARRSRLVVPAMEAGVLPADADPLVWRRALRDEVQEWGSLRWLAAVFAAVASGGIGAAAVLANDNAVGVWLVAAVVAAEGWAVHRRAGHRLRDARALLSRLPVH